MKKGNMVLRCCFVLVFTCLLGNMYGQNTWQDCVGALPICNSSYNFVNPLNGIGLDTTELPEDSICLIDGEINSAWFSFTAQNSGNLCFTITPNTFGQDYDWALFNLTGAHCDSIWTNPNAYVDGCNFYTVPGGNSGVTGANNLGGIQNIPCRPVNAGDQYVLLISNFTGGGGGFQFDLTPNTTAQILDLVGPSMNTIHTPSIECSSDSIVIEFSERIDCATIGPADFTIMGPSGPVAISSVSGPDCSLGYPSEAYFVIKVSPGFGPAGNYTIGLSGAITDQCGNVNPNADVLNFTVTNYNVNVVTTGAICLSNSGSAAVSAGGGLPPYTYLWSSGHTTPNVDSLLAGTYQVTLTDAASCQVVSAATINQIQGTPPSPFVLSTTAVSCLNNSDGSANLASNGGVSPITWLWPDGQTTASATNLSYGWHIVTVSDAYFCSDTLHVFIAGPAPINTILPSDASICIGGNIALTASASGGAGGYSFTWLNGLGNNATITVSPSMETTYYATSQDVNGCLGDTTEVKVSLLDPIAIQNLNDLIICIGDSTTINASATGGNNTFVYAWSNGVNTSSNLVNPVVETTYYLTVTNGGNCPTPPAVDSVKVRVASRPPVQIKADKSKVCPDESIEFSSDTLYPGYTYVWDFGDGQTQASSNQTISHAFLSQGCKDVALEVITDSGCVQIIEYPCMVDVYPKPNADFSFLPSIPTNKRPLVSFTNNSIGEISWRWTIDQAAVFLEENIIYEFYQVGDHSVKLLVANSFNCLDSITRFVRFEYETVFFIPNSFTPNDDGYNDTFGPLGEGLEDEGYEMIIFDRWGDEIYQTNQLSKPWEGSVKNNGNLCPEGVYNYKVTYLDYEKELHIKYGWVVLLNTF